MESEESEGKSETFWDFATAFSHLLSRVSWRKQKFSRGLAFSEEKEKREEKGKT